MTLEDAKKPGQLPLEFLLAVMHNTRHTIEVRVDAAKAAAPYVHFRKGMIDSTGRDVPITVHVVRFSEAVAPAEAVKLIDHEPSVISPEDGDGSS